MTNYNFNYHPKFIQFKGWVDSFQLYEQYLCGRGVNGAVTALVSNNTMREKNIINLFIGVIIVTMF